MYEHAEKTKENKSRAMGNSVAQKKGKANQRFGFVDNRPQAAVQIALIEMADNHSTTQRKAIQKKENNTGLPDTLKTGIEQLSGYSMGGVKVHCNSDKPAQFQAAAYTQGNHIHLGPEQEHHLGHEAWHVVQQKQGRVNATTHMKGVALNESPALEYEADDMGFRAWSTGHAMGNDTGAMTEAPLTGSEPVQRKVGLEIEVPVHHLFAGNLRERPQRRPRRQHDQYEALLDEEDVPHYGAVEDGPEFVADDAHPLVKGKSLVAGNGYKLTADIIGGQGVVEYITDPIDEQDNQNGLATIVSRIETKAAEVHALAPAYEMSQLIRNVVLRRGPDGIEGNIHITGGIKPSQIINLLHQVSGWDGTANDMNTDQSQGAVLGTAVTAARTIVGRGPEYQGLVALLGSYVGGQRIYGPLSRAAKDAIYEFRDREEGFYEMNRTVDRNDILEYMRTGDITHSDGEIDQYYGGSKGACLQELRRILHLVIAPRAAKMMVPVLSRSSLATLKGKVQMPAEGVFRADVMTAAGEPGGNDNTRLFPFGLDTPGHVGRTIEATPDITVRTWLRSIYNGQNLKFTDDTKSFEKVGPSNVPCFCGLFTTREKGAIMEIRALDGEQLVPVARWHHLAQSASDAFRALNQ